MVHGRAAVCARAVRVLWRGWLQCSRGDDDRSDDRSLCWSVETETQRATKHIRQGRTPARREGGLVGAGRVDALLRLVKQMTVLAEAVTVGKTS